MDLLYMEHPEIEGTARTTQEAFDVVWKEKGWVLVEAPLDVPVVSGAPDAAPPVDESTDCDDDPTGMVTSG